MEGQSFIPFAIPDITDREVDAVSERVRSGWLTTGSAASGFEQDVASFLGEGVFTIAVSSATAGLHLALEAAGIGPGDEVLVPDWTFTSTAEVVRYLGAVPVLVDVEFETLNIDFGSAESKVTERTKAIMPVHFAGIAVDAVKLRNFSSRHNLIVVEDAAHALPASSHGVKVGAGDSEATVYSFYATKTITTGEGGMVVTRDAKLAERMRIMRLHGISRDVFDRYSSRKPSWEYDIVAPGFKYNLNDMGAALGRVQFSRMEEMRKRREDIATLYDQAFADLPLILPAHAPAGETHSWHLYVIRISNNSAIDRDQLIDHLAGASIGTSVHFIPLHRHTYWATTSGQGPAELPISDDAANRTLSLPLYSAMSDDDVNRVIDAVLDAFK